MDLEKLKYPTGKLKYEKPTADLLKQGITDIENFPKKIKTIINGLSAEQLNWPYRPKGWAIKQVVHHCADSHMNAIIRFKLALTENKPTIKPYEEALWANLPDMANDLSDSIILLEGIHNRWTTLLKSLTQQELERTYVHPEYNKTFDLATTVGMYAWHCNHHYAHIKQALDHKGKF
ncbi:MAG TPA: putative metal-dependent hydrolase [Fulvivirga sp.]|nr:putative metal-dependent hydrolase [Fulvivirga sp.]